MAERDCAAPLDGSEATAGGAASDGPASFDWPFVSFEGVEGTAGVVGVAGTAGVAGLVPAVPSSCAIDTAGAVLTAASRKAAPAKALTPFTLLIVGITGPLGDTQ